MNNSEKYFFLILDIYYFNDYNQVKGRKQNFNLIRAGVGKVQPADHMRSMKGKSATRDHVFYFTWDAAHIKVRHAAREHANVARKKKVFKLKRV